MKRITAMVVLEVDVTDKRAETVDAVQAFIGAFEQAEIVAVMAAYEPQEDNP